MQSRDDQVLTESTAIHLRYLTSHRGLTEGAVSRHGSIPRVDEVRNGLPHLTRNTRGNR